ncbi:hypothetical protein PA598K_02159 [Paenibacillus sp. 598K]|uniref:hypothetical protein n=1 Tax=Paenibacillus sp. 598K TaxID=1117987 RepID=UPI000FFAF16C|nr:hypothetical protein [Paenibacillus sp. 598K]GBF73836.1 hypothetical protein PA598K_02159 [Paenibacillus sp. 598K]
MMDLALAQDKKFWARYEWRLQDDFAYQELEEEPIRLPVTDEVDLVLDTGEDFSYISLMIDDGDEEMIEIAWDDEAHFHPFVLRMEEWQRLSRQISSRAGVPEWIPALLLQRFVGYDSPGELEAILRQGMELRRLSGLYTADELAAWPEHPFLAQPSLWDKLDRRWREQPPYGWVFEGEDAYSLRIAGNPDFPFDAWNQMLASLSGDKEQL